MKKFSIPPEETIQTFETIFLLLFSAGLISFTVWITFQYPFVSVTLCGIGVLLLLLAKMIRKKRDKVAQVQSKPPEVEV